MSTHELSLAFELLLGYAYILFAGATGVPAALRVPSSASKACSEARGLL